MTREEFTARAVLKDLGLELNAHLLAACVLCVAAGRQAGRDAALEAASREIEFFGGRRPAELLARTIRGLQI